MDKKREQKIKNKSNKELYNIFINKENKNKNYRNIAKDELIKRNFDFDNIEKNKIEWEYIELMKESISETFNRSSSYSAFTFKFYITLNLVMILLISLLFFSLPWKDVVSFILFMIVFLAIPFFISRYTYKIKRNKETKRILRMSELKKILRENENYKIIEKRIEEEREYAHKKINDKAVFFIILFVLILLSVFIIKSIFF